MNKLKKGDKVYLGSEEWEVAEIDCESCDYPYRVVNKVGEMLWIKNNGRSFGYIPPLFSMTPYTMQNFTPLNTEIFEKGQLVFVKNDKDDLWEARFYSHFEDGKHYCFVNQKKESETNICWKFIAAKID